MNNCDSCSSRIVQTISYFTQHGTIASRATIMRVKNYFSGGELVQERSAAIGKLQFMLFPFVYNLGVMVTLMITLVMLSTKAILIGLILLFINVGNVIGKLKHEYYQHHDHLHNFNHHDPPIYQWKSEPPPPLPPHPQPQPQPHPHPHPHPQPFHVHVHNSNHEKHPEEYVEKDHEKFYGKHHGKRIETPQPYDDHNPYDHDEQHMYDDHAEWDDPHRSVIPYENSNIPGPPISKG